MLVAAIAQTLWICSSHAFQQRIDLTLLGRGILIMEEIMGARRILTAVAILTGMVGTTAAHAVTLSNARIALYHLNSTVQDRGVCVRTSPPLPGTGWACVWKDNELYEEITDLLLDAYLTRKRCNYTWNGLDPNGHNLLLLLECLP
jgi:hypothetical protein